MDKYADLTCQANVAKPTSAETVNMEENEQGEQYLKVSQRIPRVVGSRGAGGGRG